MSHVTHAAQLPQLLVRTRRPGGEVSCKLLRYFSKWAKLWKGPFVCHKLFKSL